MKIDLKQIPFFRWSFLKLIFGLKKLNSEWQVGDGREAKLLEYVEANAKKSDPQDVIRIIDEYAYTKSFLINVGDEKGEILDQALRAANPQRILELGTYCGYSALRMAVVAPSAQIICIEYNLQNANIAQKILEYAGVSNRVEIIHGYLGDGGQTINTLNRDYAFTPESLDFVFIDHDKDEYIPDLHRILDNRWLHPGSVVVADNIKFPGAPEYFDYMMKHESQTWKTTQHQSFVEYQSVIKDMVLVSEYLGSKLATD